MNRPMRWLAATVAIVALGAGSWGLLRLATNPRAEAAASPNAPDAGGGTAPSPLATGNGVDLAAPPAAAVPVETALARRGDLVMKITATGTAEATRQLQVQAALAGTVQQVPVREGQLVAAGDLLVALDDAELRLKVQMQREALVRSMARFAEKQMFLSETSGGSSAARELVEAQQQVIGGVISREQFRELIDDPRFDELFSSITRQEVMAAQDGLLTDRANYAMARIDLERARITAPFGGQTADLKVVPGQRVGPGAPLLILVDADPIRVRAQVLESESAPVRVGRSARVRFAAFPDQEMTGRIDLISPLVDAETKTLQVVIALPNPELRVRPGMFAQISLDTEVYHDRVLVPAAAVLLRDERPMLFIVRQDRAQWVYIQQGRSNGDWVEVLDGVQPGDEVVVSGHYSLAHDAAVRVVSRSDAEPGQAP